MILPEHRAAILKQQDDLKKRKKPILDEQRIEELSYIVQAAIREKKQVEVTIFGEFEDRKERGFVDRVEPTRFRLWKDFGFEWVRIEDVLNIEIKEA